MLLHGPEGEDFQFPIVTGLSESLPREERERRMQTYQEFMKEVDLVKPGSSDQISELDLSNPRDFACREWPVLDGSTDDAPRHRPLWSNRFHQQIPDAGGKFCAMAGQFREQCILLIFSIPGRWW